MTSAVAFALLAAGGAPATAQAGLLDGGRTTLDLSPLQQLLSTTQAPALPPLLPLPPLPSVEDVVTGLPVVGEIPAVGDVGRTVDDLLGNAGVPGLIDTLRSGVFVWQTTYRAPNGQLITRSHPGVVLVPLPLNVDDTPVPDVLAQLEPGVDGTISVRITRLPTAPARMPLKAEMIVTADNSQGAGNRVTFGYDTLDSEAPEMYQATARLTDGGSVSIDSAIVGGGSAITQQGKLVELRNGGVEADPKSASIRFAPVPATSHIGLLTSGDGAADQTRVELSTAVPTRADIAADINEGADRTLANVVVDRLPGSVALGLDADQSGARTLSYSAGGAVDRLTLGLEQRHAGVANQRLEAALTDLPASLQVAQSGRRALVDASGPIGVIEVAGSSGAPLARLDDDQYVLLREQGADQLYALRIRGLKSGELDSGDQLTVRATSLGGRFRLLQETGAQRIEAIVEDLPPEVSLAYDPAAQTLRYDGSAVIDRLAVTATDPAGLQGSRATRLDATLRQVPLGLTLGLGDGGELDLAARDGVLGSLDALLTSGPAPAIADGEDGVLVEDVPDHLVAVARLSGLRGASLRASGEPSLHIDSIAGRRFTVRVKQAATPAEPIRRIDAAIDALQPDTRIGVIESAAGPLIRLSSAEPTNAIDLEAENLPGLDGLDPRARLLRATLRGLPRTLDLGLTGDASGGIGIDAGGETLGLLQVLLTSGPEDTLPDGTDGFRLTDTPAQYTVFGRVTQLKSISVAASPRPQLAIDSTAGNPFTVELTQQAASDPVAQHLIATIDHLRPQTAVSYVENGGSPSLRFSAAERTGLVTVAGENVTAVAGRARNLRVTLTDVPTRLDLGFSQEAGRLEIGTGDDVLGELSALITSGPELALPAGTDGLLLEDVADHYTIAARLTGLKSVSVALAPEPAVRLDLAGGRPFLARLDQLDAASGEVRHLEASIDLLERNTSVALTTVDGVPKIHFGADEPTGVVHVAATNLIGLVDRAKNFDILLTGLPTSLDLSLAQGADGAISIDAGDQTLGSLQVSADDGLGPVTLPDPAADGIKLISTPERFAAFARITALRKVSVALAPTPQLELDTLAGKRFLAEVDTSDIPFATPATVRASIDSVKPHTRVAYTLVGGAPHVTFAADAPTGAVDLSAADLPGLGDRVRQIAIKLRELPTQLDLGLDVTTTALNIDANGQRLGLLEAQLSSDGVDRSFDASRDGLLLEDVADHYAAFARLTGLNKVNITLDPAPRILLDLDGGRPFDAHLRLAPAVAGDPPTALDVAIPRLERNTDLKYVLTAGGPRFSFDAAARTQGITLVGTGVSGLSARARDLSLRLDDIPQHLDISLAQEAGRFDIDAGGDELGLLEVLLTNGFDATLPASTDGLKLVDTPSTYALFGRITKLRRVQVAIAPAPQLELDTGERRPFVAEIDQSPLTGGPTQVIRASIDALQPNTAIRYLDTDAGPKVEFRAGAPTGAVDLNADNLAGLGDRVSHLELKLRALPASLDLGLSSATGTVAIDAAGQRLGSIEALLSDGGSVSKPPTGTDGLSLLDTPSRYALFGRVTGLRKVEVKTSPAPDLTLQTDGGQPFDASLTQQAAGQAAPSVITAQLRNLQQDTHIALTTSGAQRFVYSAAAPANRLTITGSNLTLGRATSINLDITSLPTALDLDLGGSGGAITLDTGGQTIGTLTALLTSGPSLAPAPNGTDDGLALIDTPSQYTISARITGLRRIVAITSPQPNLQLDATGNMIFHVNITQGATAPITAKLDRLQRNTTVSLVTVGGRQDIVYTAATPTNRLDFSANGISANLSNPLPSSFTVCQAADNACGGSGRAANGGSARLIANQHTTLNLNSAAFVVTNMRVKRMTYDAQVESAGTFGSGARGHIYLDTDNEQIDGDARVDQSGIVDYVQINLRNVRAQDRLGKFKPGFLGFGVVSDGKTGTISCGAGTDLYAQTTLLGLRVGLTGLLC